MLNPVISDGRISGFFWILLNTPPKALARVLARRVFPVSAIPSYGRFVYSLFIIIPFSRQPQNTYLGTETLDCGYLPMFFIVVKYVVQIISEINIF